VWESFRKNRIFIKCVASHANEYKERTVIMLLTDEEKIMFIATEILKVDRPEKNVFDLIKIGDYVKVDATAGIIEVVGE